MTTRLSTKGQLVVPKELRQQLGWKAGAELQLNHRNGQLVVSLVLDQFPETTVDDLVGCTGYKGPRKSLAEMDAGIARGARESR